MNYHEPVSFSLKDIKICQRLGCKRKTLLRDRGLGGVGIKANVGLTCGGWGGGGCWSTCIPLAPPAASPWWPPCWTSIRPYPRCPRWSSKSKVWTQPPAKTTRPLLQRWKSTATDHGFTGSWKQGRRTVWVSCDPCLPVELVAFTLRLDEQILLFGHQNEIISAGWESQTWLSIVSQRRIPT